MSDTSGQDTSGGGQNSVFSSKPFQTLFQKYVQLVAQMHGGQAPGGPAAIAGNALGGSGMNAANRLAGSFAPPDPTQQQGAPQGGPASLMAQQGAGAPPQGGQPPGGPGGLAPAP